MSTKRFCDFCDGEITSDRSHDGTYNSKATLKRSGGSHRRQDLNVSIRLSPTTDAESMPDICAGCVFTAVRSIDPTPRELEG